MMDQVISYLSTIAIDLYANMLLFFLQFSRETSLHGGGMPRGRRETGSDAHQKLQRRPRRQLRNATTRPGAASALLWLRSWLRSWLRRSRRFSGSVSRSSTSASFSGECSQGRQQRTRRASPLCSPASPSPSLLRSTSARKPVLLLRFPATTTCRCISCRLPATSSGSSIIPGRLSGT